MTKLNITDVCYVAASMASDMDSDDDVAGDVVSEIKRHRPIKNRAHQFNSISHTIHQDDHYSLEYIPNFSSPK